MFQVGGCVFKMAATDDEIEQIHRLNCRTFALEIPQHADPGDGRLVDKFHDRNVYLIAVRDGKVIGMLSVHDQQPFSTASRLADSTIICRAGTNPLEVRLLAVEPGKRQGIVFAGLAWLVYLYCREHGYTHLFISGVEERLELYRHIGFSPLGPAVQDGAARFVPMRAVVDELPSFHERFVELWTTRKVEPTSSST